MCRWLTLRVAARFPEQPPGVRGHTSCPSFPLLPLHHVERQRPHQPHTSETRRPDAQEPGIKATAQHGLQQQCTQRRADATIRSSSITNLTLDGDCRQRGGSSDGPNATQPFRERLKENPLRQPPPKENPLRRPDPTENPLRRSIPSTIKRTGTNLAKQRQGTAGGADQPTANQTRAEDKQRERPPRFNHRPTRRQSTPSRPPHSFPPRPGRRSRTAGGGGKAAVADGGGQAHYGPRTQHARALVPN